METQIANKSKKDTSNHGSSWVDLPENENTPSARSLHTMVYLENSIYIFGGYDGTIRTNDLFKYDIVNQKWNKILATENLPSPRERHVAVVNYHSIFVFAGYDGVNRLNDFFEFNTDSSSWQEVVYSGSGVPPTPRHSSCGVVYDGNMYVFGGYDGNCRSDLNRFNFETSTWAEIKKTALGSGSWPRERYRTSAAIFKNLMYLYGGHDGGKQLEDFWEYNFKSSTWKLIDVKPNLPSLRDSHITFVYNDSLYIHGGSSANNIFCKGDFFEFNFRMQKWMNLKYFINDNSTNHVFCHGGVFVEKYENFYIFGGYNGITRLNDFKYFKLKEDNVDQSICTQNFLKNLESFCNNPKFADLTLISSDDQIIYCHKIILTQVPFFDNLFNLEMKESRAAEIKIKEIPFKILLKVVRYIYTLNCPVEYEDSINLYEAANYFGIEELKKICEEKVLSIVNVENSCDILRKADEYNSLALKEKIMKYMIENIHEVILSPSFEQLIKNNELTLEFFRKFALSKESSDVNAFIINK